MRDWESDPSTREARLSHHLRLNTFSGHIAMDPSKRERLDAEIRRYLAERPDGLLHRHWGAVLHVARRRDERGDR